jgi:hypothetical protein
MVSLVGVPSDPTCFSFRLPCFTLVLSVLESLVQVAGVSALRTLVPAALSVTW